jgi:GNAT superfamily N-acetyltransferase
METMHTIRTASSRADWDEAAALVHDHVEWMRGWTDFDPLVAQPALSAELDDLAAHYDSSDAAFLLADWRSSIVGAVAVRRLRDGSAELKRLYVRPVARGRGIGDALVAAAVDAAAELGCNTVWLETIRGVMDAAIALYRRNGFVETAVRSPTLSIGGVVVMERDISRARKCA